MGGYSFRFSSSDLGLSHHFAVLVIHTCRVARLVYGNRNRRVALGRSQRHNREIRGDKIAVGKSSKNVSNTLLSHYPVSRNVVCFGIGRSQRIAAELAASPYNCPVLRHQTPARGV